MTNLVRVDDDGEVIGIEDEYKVMPEFKALWTLDYNKGPRDHDGRKRLRAKSELLYMWSMYSPRTPYRDYSEKDREEQSREDSSLPPEWEPSKELSVAIEKYKKCTETRFYKLLLGAEKAIDKVRDYLNTVDLTQTTSGGSLVNHPTDVMRVISDLPKMAAALKSLEEQAKYDIVSTSKSKGDHEVGWMAISEENN